MNLLIVAPYFPPHSSVAVVRIASLTRHLIESGYNITVLTNKLDTEKQKSNNDISLESINKIEVDMSTGNNKFFANKTLYVKAFHKVMQESKFDCVLITSGPFYTLPLCKISKVNYNTKCIIDFRDLWILDVRSIKKFIRPSSLARKLVFYPIERQAIKYADQIVTVTDGWSNILKRMYPRYKDKNQVIYNGYDDKYLNQDKRSQSANKALQYIDENALKIMSFGKMSYYSKEYSTVFFRALKRMHEKNTLINIIQIGTEEAETLEVIKETNFNVTKYFSTGFCDYQNGMSLLAESDICIIIDIRKQAIGTKIYDYIYMNKPIIYVGKKKTYLSKLISSFDNGYVCQTEDQIIQSLIDILDNDIKNLDKKSQSKKYSRQVQNKRYSIIIKNVIKGE